MFAIELMNIHEFNREKVLANFDEKIEIRERERCKGVHCVDLGESFPTHIYLQHLASIQPRTSRSTVADSNAENAPRRPAAGPAGGAGSQRARRGGAAGPADP